MQRNALSPWAQILRRLMDISLSPAPGSVAGTAEFDFYASVIEQVRYLLTLRSAIGLTYCFCFCFCFCFFFCTGCHCYTLLRHLRHPRAARGRLYSLCASVSGAIPGGVCQGPRGGRPAAVRGPSAGSRLAPAREAGLRAGVHQKHQAQRKHTVLLSSTVG